MQDLLQNKSRVTKKFGSLGHILYATYGYHQVYDKPYTWLQNPDESHTLLFNQKSGRILPIPVTRADRGGGDGWIGVNPQTGIKTFYPDPVVSHGTYAVKDRNGQYYLGFYGLKQKWFWVDATKYPGDKGWYTKPKIKNGRVIRPSLLYPYQNEIVRFEEVEFLGEGEVVKKDDFKGKKRGFCDLIVKHGTIYIVNAMFIDRGNSFFVVWTEDCLDSEGRPAKVQRKGFLLNSADVIQATNSVKDGGDDVYYIVPNDEDFNLPKIDYAIYDGEINSLVVVE